MTHILVSRTAHASSTMSSMLSHAATPRDLATSGLHVFTTETRCASHRSQEIAITSIGPLTGKTVLFHQPIWRLEYIDLWAVLVTLAIAFTIRCLRKPPAREVPSPATYQRDAKGAQTPQLFCLFLRAGRHTPNIRWSIPTCWHRSAPQKHPDPGYELQCLWR